MDTRIYCAQGAEHTGVAGKGCLSETTFVFKGLFDFDGYQTGAIILDTERMMATTSDSRSDGRCSAGD